MGIGMDLGNYCNDGGCVMRGWDLDGLRVCVCVCVCVSLICALVLLTLYLGLLLLSYEDLLLDQSLVDTTYPANDGYF